MSIMDLVYVSIIEYTAGEHTLHGDAAAIRALSFVPRFGVGSFVVGSAPQAAAHVNFVFGGAVDTLLWKDNRGHIGL